MDLTGATSYAKLDNFDWSLRMVLSSDKVSGLRRPLLLLKLQTLNPDNSTASNLIEMDANELNKLLKNLKAAQKVTNI